jgi:uracil-DNA glycosylase
MPSYHPSALLAAPKNKRLFWSDLLQIKAKLAE